MINELIMKHRDIRVSVVMACHNSSEYLDEAVRSVLCQTLREFELIIVDDCSTDNTLAIAQRYPKQDKRVSVVSLLVNSGPAMARNVGIKVARGEWVAILDSDDIAVATRFEEQMGLAESDDELVLVGSGSVSIDAMGHTLTMHNYPTTDHKLSRRLTYKQAFPTHSSMVYRKIALDKLGGFNPRYVRSQDYDLWLRLSEIGKMATVDKKLVKIRKHGRNISNLEGGKCQEKLSTAALICHFLRTSGVPDPSVDFDDKSWQDFLAWIDNRLQQENVYGKVETWANASARYFLAENRVNGMLRLVVSLVRSGCAKELIWGKIFGSTLGRRLADEWKLGMPSGLVM